MKTQVVHLKRDSYDSDNYEYIGRPGIWGNPFTIGKDGIRKEVIQKYEKYIRNNKMLMPILYTLKGKYLGCWCKPSACHGDVLVKLIKEKYGKDS